VDVVFMTFSVIASVQGQKEKASAPFGRNPIQWGRRRPIEHEPALVPADEFRRSPLTFRLLSRKPRASVWTVIRSLSAPNRV
jgi:hypothetical protein